MALQPVAVKPRLPNPSGPGLPVLGTPPPSRHHRAIGAPPHTTRKTVAKGVGWSLGWVFFLGAVGVAWATDGSPPNLALGAAHVAAGAAEGAAPYIPVGANPPAIANASQRPFATPQLAALFDRFDTSGDGLDFEEAASFFQWVEDHIAYRYDREEVPSSIVGYAVGDGRPGAQYQQTPEETLNERAGDCEDQGALELAFYRHFGVSAYLALVNAVDNDTVDHAVTIVRGSDTRTGLIASLGEVPYYHMEGRRGVEDGYYFLVDNTYSSVFARVTGGIGASKFLIHDTMAYEDLFADRLAPVVPESRDGGWPAGPRG